eukprot:m.627671 g.627671  ORF g.627671 m.627671 type:complete len:174 (-) comp22561_c0_seq7:421-942(-)
MSSEHTAAAHQRMPSAGRCACNITCICDIDFGVTTKQVMSPTAVSAQKCSTPPTHNQPPQLFQFTSDGHLNVVGQQNMCLNAPEVHGGGGGEIWARPLTPNATTGKSRVAALFFNPTAATVNVTGTLASLGINTTSAQTVRDLWLHKDLGSTSGPVTVSLASHASRMFVLTEA